MISKTLNIVYNEISASKSAPREDWISLLRALSCIFVISIHVSAYYLNRSETFSEAWIIANIYDSFSRWSVQVFVMASGFHHYSQGLHIFTFGIYI